MRQIGGGCRVGVVARGAGGRGVSVGGGAVGEQAMQRAAQALQEWRAAHPQASFRELEEAVERQLQRCARRC